MTNDIPVKVIVDLSKPEGEREQIIPLTEAEITEREQLAIQAAEEQQAREAEQQRIASLRTSAKAKLIAGEPMTAEEADTLLR